MDNRGNKYGILENIYCIYANFFRSDHDIRIMWENILVLGKSMLKCSGMLKVCNFQLVREKIFNTHRERNKILVMLANWRL